MDNNQRELVLSNLHNLINDMSELSADVVCDIIEMVSYCYIAPGQTITPSNSEAFRIFNEIQSLSNDLRNLANN